MSSIQAYVRAVATGTAGMAMAVPLFDKIANNFEQILLRHTVVCRATKKVACNTCVLFAHTKISPISTSRILKTTKRISTKFTYFMLYIYLTLHTKFDIDCASGSQDICS